LSFSYDLPPSTDINPQTGLVSPSCPSFLKMIFLFVYDDCTRSFIATFPYICIIPQIGSSPPLFSFWHKNRHEDQWNRIEDPDMKPQNYNQLVFDKGAKNI
jgi:hypothetical protein